MQSKIEAFFCSFQQLKFAKSNQIQTEITKIGKVKLRISHSGILRFFFGWPFISRSTPVYNRLYNTRYTPLMTILDHRCIQCCCNYAVIKWLHYEHDIYFIFLDFRPQVRSAKLPIAGRLTSQPYYLCTFCCGRGRSDGRTLMQRGNRTRTAWLVIRSHKR